MVPPSRLEISHLQEGMSVALDLASKSVLGKQDAQEAERNLLSLEQELRTTREEAKGNGGASGVLNEAKVRSRGDPSMGIYSTYRGQIQPQKPLSGLHANRRNTVLPEKPSHLSSEGRSQSAQSMMDALQPQVHFPASATIQTEPKN